MIVALKLDEVNQGNVSYTYKYVCTYLHVPTCVRTWRESLTIMRTTVTEPAWKLDMYEPHASHVRQRGCDLANASGTGDGSEFTSMATHSANTSPFDNEAISCVGLACVLGFEIHLDVPWTPIYSPSASATSG